MRMRMSLSHFDNGAEEKENVKGSEEKASHKERKASSASQGKDSGSRKKFVLPAKWKEFQQGSKKQLKFSSPGKEDCLIIQMKSKKH